MRKPLPTAPSMPRRGLLAAGLGSVAAVAACSEEAPADTGGAGGGESPEESASPEAPRLITITHVGDTMPGSYPDQLPDDEGASFFDGVKNELTGDVVIANMEGALSTAEHDKCGGGECYQFRLPGEYAQVFADAGFHVLNQANNHGWDAGPDGAVETQTAIREAGMEVAGVKDEVVYVETENGLTLGICGFAPYEYFTDVRDLDAVAALITEAGSNADLVLATAHLGAEGVDYQHTPEGSELFYGEDRGDSRAFARTCIDAGADLVIGHGPHVLRGMEVYEGKLVVYSLGNFGGGQNLFSLDGPLGIAGIVKVTLDEEGTLQEASFVSSKMDGDGYPRLDDEAAALDSINELAADFGDAGVTAGDDGALVLPGA